MKLFLIISLCILSISLHVFSAGEYYRCPGQPLKYEWLKLAEKHCSDPHVCYTVLRPIPLIYDDWRDRRLIGHPTMEKVELCGNVFAFEYEKVKRLNHYASPDLIPTESEQATVLQEMSSLVSPVE